MNSPALLIAALLPLGAALAQSGPTVVHGREQIALESSSARVVMDLAGGAIGEFRFKDSTLNPLNWGSPKPDDRGVHGFGHFLCLDRWGPASDAEAKRGMAYHGEASNVRWQLERAPAPGRPAEVTARLPKAGLAIRRTIQISPAEAVFSVREEVTNENPLGRVYNMVQHPTIAPPFLDKTTVVDCNGLRGFAQGGTLPNPEEPFSTWPVALKKSGEEIDLRHLTNDPDPNVVSYEVDGAYGWVTAATPGQGLLIGYLWRKDDYPWVSLWRDVRDGQPAARGLEFGTTGLHQPFPTLVKKGYIWGLPLLDYIDAGQTITRQYVSFLVRIPEDFAGIETATVRDGTLTLMEKKATNKRREFTISLRGLPAFPNSP